MTELPTFDGCALASSFSSSSYEYSSGGLKRRDSRNSGFLYQNQTTNTAAAIHSIAVKISIRVSNPATNSVCILKSVFAQLLHESVEWSDSCGPMRPSSI